MRSITVLLSLLLGLGGMSHAVPVTGELSSHGPSQNNLTSTSATSGMALSIDLTQCHCLETTVPCEIVIMKSNLMEVDCPKTHQFCCKTAQKLHKVKDEVEKTDTRNPIVQELVPMNGSIPLPSLVNSTSLEQNDNETVQMPKIRMKILTVQDLIRETEPVPEVNEDTTTEEKPKVKCRCKPKANCSDEYVDYSFGFHCSYDRVRCCVPYELYQEEMKQNGGGLITLKDFGLDNDDPNFNTSSTANSFEDNQEAEYINNCLCVPESECDIKTINEITKRKDMACPFNYIQCCGSSLMVNKSDYLTLDKSYNEEGVIPSEGEYIEGRGMASNLIPSTRQKPVQLPERIIPQEPISMNTAGRDLLESGQGQDSYAESIPSTVAPPTLPNYYYRPSQDTANEKGQMYYHQSVRRPIQQTQPYFTGKIVQFPSSGPVSSYQNPQTYYSYNSPRSNDKSILDSIYSFFG